MADTCKCTQSHDFLPVHAFNAIQRCNSCYKRICYMVSAIIHGSLKLYFLIKQHPKLNKEHQEQVLEVVPNSFSNPKLELTFSFPLCIFISRHNSLSPCSYWLYYIAILNGKWLRFGLMFQYQSSPI